MVALNLKLEEQRELQGADSRLILMPKSDGSVAIDYSRDRGRIKGSVGDFGNNTFTQKFIPPIYVDQGMHV